jgi:hypothetical protein
MKELWSRLLIVGFGEVDEGAFPSLAVGATRLLFEPLYEEAKELAPGEAGARLLPLRRASPEIARFLDRELRLRTPPSP